MGNQSADVFLTDWEDFCGRMGRRMGRSMGRHTLSVCISRRPPGTASTGARSDHEKLMMVRSRRPMDD